MLSGGDELNWSPGNFVSNPIYSLTNVQQWCSVQWAQNINGSVDIAAEMWWNITIGILASSRYVVRYLWIMRLYYPIEIVLTLDMKINILVPMLNCPYVWKGRGRIKWKKNQPLQWCYNERDGVSNHRRLDYLLNRLFRCRSGVGVTKPISSVPLFS